jgi:nitric-oxide synthase, bacterial
LPAVTAVDLASAEDFVRMFHDAHPSGGPLGPRLAAVRTEIAETGTYRHTAAELAYGARIALRDSGWCASGVPWRRLKVRDLRGLRKAAAVAAECWAHLRVAAGGGELTPLITVFAPDTPDLPGPRIWNDQLHGYAGHADGAAVLGDRRYAGFTAAARELGWQPPQRPTRFDPLPLVVETAQEGPTVFELPADARFEVPLTHPDLPWFAELGLRWSAAPVIANLELRIGGLCYPAAPFNTWHIGTEIGTRALADESGYGIAAEVARRLGLDTSSERTLWRDRVIVECNRAVLHSFDTAGVPITDHHAEAAHRLAWLRSRRTGADRRGGRPRFHADAGRTERARNGGPPRFPAAASAPVARQPISA